jgi:Xaa-Pro aminopeptidase
VEADRTPRTIIDSRIKKLREAMAKLGAGSLLISQPENVQYVTGFRAVGNPPKTSWVLILGDREEVYLLVPALEYYEAEEEAKAAKVVKISRDKSTAEGILEFLAEVKAPGPIFTDCLQDRDLIEALKKKTGEPRSMQAIIENLRAKKDEYEVSCIKEAIKKTMKGIERAQEVLREGVKETRLLAEIERALWEEDIEGLAFDVIVASGLRSSYPHARPSAKRVERGDSVVIDVGVRVQGYCSDITRTFIVGGNPEAERALTCVINVQNAVALDVKSGVRASDLNAKARKLLEDEGLHEYFLHGLGHGLGLSVHEKPIISSLSEDILEGGNVITLEPGVYVKGRFGVRHEDVFLVGENSCVKLS